jgi:hypothetical protein
MGWMHHGRPSKNNSITTNIGEKLIVFVMASLLLQINEQFWDIFICQFYERPEKTKLGNGAISRIP